MDSESEDSLEGSTIVEGDEGTTDASFTARLNIPSNRTIKVNYNTNPIIVEPDRIFTSFQLHKTTDMPLLSVIDDEAKAGEDYEATSGVLTFNPGETTKTFTVPIIGDTKEELDERFTVYLLDPNLILPIQRPDILATAKGIIKNDDTTVSNEAPSFPDLTFNIAENSDKETIIGTLNATDPNNDQLTFKITNNVNPDEDGNKAFTIDGDRLLVNDKDDLNYETNPILNITIEASDGELTDAATVTVNLTDVDENQAPEFLDQSFNIAENSDKETIIGTLNATHPEDKPLTFSIINNVDPDEDGNKAFTIDGDRLLVNDKDDLNYETNPILNITIEASDGELTDAATVTVNLSDVQGLTIIESEGTATFAKYSDDSYWIINGEKELQLQNRKGKTYSDSTNRNWNGAAVEVDESGGYRFLLQGQNARSGQAYVWTTNSQGVITRGSRWKSKGALLPLEQEFNVDLNGDEIIGNSFTTIEEEGTATFAKNLDDTYWIISGDWEVQLQNRKGKTYSDSTNRNWNGAAVEVDESGGYRFLLQGQNARSGQAYVWTTNSQGVITRGSGWKSKGALLPLEQEFNIDLNGDEIIGNSFTTIEQEGTATFAKNLDDTYWIINGDQQLQLQNRQGRSYTDNTTPNWDGVAVELGSADSYRVLLQRQNARSGQAYVWTTNSEGIITRGSGWKSQDALFPLEQEFNIDLNGDGIFGSPL